MAEKDSDFVQLMEWVQLQKDNKAEEKDRSDSLPTSLSDDNSDTNDQNPADGEQTDKTPRERDFGNPLESNDKVS